MSPNGGAGTPATSDRPRLLLIEDNPDLGPLIADALDEEYQVTLACDGDDGLEAGRTGSYEAIVLDRRLPGADGIAVVLGLRAAGVRTPVLMLTALGSADDQRQGLDAGADDYLVKPFDFAELGMRVRALRRVHDDGDESDAATRLGEWVFRPAAHLLTSPRKGRRVLTETETRLLLLFARHPNTTFSRERILREIFPSGDGVGTVDAYIRHIRRKTDRGLIRTVRGRGYRLRRR